MFNILSPKARTFSRKFIIGLDLAYSNFITIKIQPQCKLECVDSLHQEVNEVSSLVILKYFAIYMYVTGK